jgi:hypothetical protein
VRSTTCTLFTTLVLLLVSLGCRAAGVAAAWLCDLMSRFGSLAGCCAVTEWCVCVYVSVLKCWWLFAAGHMYSSKAVLLWLCACRRKVYDNKAHVAVVCACIFYSLLAICCWLANKWYCGCVCLQARGV